MKNLLNELKNNSNYRLEETLDLIDILKENNICKILKKKYMFEISKNENECNNLWIQQILGVLVMIKDFICGYKLFNFDIDSSSSKDYEYFYIFDKYWDFSISNDNYKLESESEQFHDLLLKTKKN